MSIETVSLHETIDQEFARIWLANEMNEVNEVDIAGRQAVYDQLDHPGEFVSTVKFTEVTLRDGQQQQTDDVTTEQRVEVFDQIVSTGIDRIEIGHLGNKNGDQQLATALIRHIAEKEKTDERYGQVQLQVLFGSQEGLIRDGSDVLARAYQDSYGEDWQTVMAERVVVHVYDRLDQSLIDTASNPYTPQESAKRVVAAARHAVDAGFKHFSISGEAATAVPPEEAVQFYRAVTQSLLGSKADTVNVNLANTYGYSECSQWNTATLAYFNNAVKYGFDDKVTTSVHAHNDVNSAGDFSVRSMVAGFDRVEGTLDGMGERAGNVALSDVAMRIIEQAHHTYEAETRRSRVAEALGRLVIQRTIKLDQSIVESFGNWYEAGKGMAETFGPHAIFRWEQTVLGNPYAHDNGSGPHDQAAAAAIKDPVNHAFDSNYAWALRPSAMLGHPDGEDIAVGDPPAIKKVTVGNHAGGGNTDKILSGTVDRASEDVVDEARRAFQERTAAITQYVLNGVVVHG